MSPPAITLRAANPTLADGREYARFLDIAAEGFFRFLLGRRSEEIVAKAFLQPGHDLSHEHVTFAERDGTVVGMASGYTAEQHRQASKKPLAEAAGRFPLRLMVLSTLCSPMIRILDSIGDGEFYLQAIAVDSEARGQGIGTTLMDFIEEQAVARGASRLALDVSATNETARSVYERRGMSIESQWPKRIPLPKIRFLRMTKPLRADP